MKVLLLDIEGTITSIAFVYETLFPYARAAFEATFAGRGPLVARWQEPEVGAALALMAGGAGRHDPHAAAGAALALMHADVKDTGLKALQGIIWRDGYRRGELRGHVFSDVAEALRLVSASGVRVAIYSSGSVAAQRLLFAYSDAGDLTPHLAAYFDTTTGPKKEAASYRAIAAELDVAPAEIRFLSDNLDEVRAAIAAGCEALVAVRPGNPPLPPDHGLMTFSSLLDARVTGIGSAT